MDGFVLINKPIEWTSFDVVSKVRRIIELSGVSESQKKRFPVGHTGTLDPLATGLLILVLGSYCKRAQEFTKLDKKYSVRMTLGYESTTDDEEGQKTEISNSQPLESEVLQCVQSFLGISMQVPPIYSAIKIHGKRSYELARDGKSVNLPPREVTIYAVHDVAYHYPSVTFTVDVSSGTYIRSLVRNIGERLKTGAYMTSLERVSVGSWKVEDALQMDNLNAKLLQNHMKVVETAF
ncbi:MAG: hypothetical protein NVSMB46_00670 [Candidatus Saccharimonadales bacterium]